MAQRRAITTAVYYSQIFVWIGLVLPALPIITASTWTQQPIMNYTISHDTTVCNCAALRTELGICIGLRQNKCNVAESEEKDYFAYLKNENITALCWPGHEVEGNIVTPGGSSDQCRPCNNCGLFTCILPWVISFVYMVQLIIQLMLALRRYKRGKFDQDEDGTRTRPTQILHNENLVSSPMIENGLTEPKSNGFPMTPLDESTESSVFVNMKYSRADIAEYSQNPPALSTLRRRYTFKSDSNPSEDNTWATVGPEFAKISPDDSKTTQSNKNRERSEFQKAVRQILKIDSSSSSNDKVSDDELPGISQRSNVPSEGKGSSEAGTSTESRTARSEVVTRVIEGRPITRESCSNESSDHTDYSDSENASRRELKKGRCSSSDDESDNDKPAGSSQKSRLPSKIRGSSEAGTSTELSTLYRRGFEQTFRLSKDLTWNNKGQIIKKTSGDSKKNDSYESCDSSNSEKAALREHKTGSIKESDDDINSSSKKSRIFSSIKRTVPVGERRSRLCRPLNLIHCESLDLDMSQIENRKKSGKKRVDAVIDGAHELKAAKWFLTPSIDRWVIPPGTDQKSQSKESPGYRDSLDLKKDILKEPTMPQTEQRKSEGNEEKRILSEARIKENINRLEVARRGLEKEPRLKQKTGISTSDSEIKYDKPTGSTQKSHLSSTDNPEYSQESQADKNRDKPTEEAGHRKVDKGSAGDKKSDDEIDESHIIDSYQETSLEHDPSYSGISKKGKRRNKWNSMAQPTSAYLMQNMWIRKIFLLLIALFTLCMFVANIYLCMNIFEKIRNAVAPMVDTFRRLWASLYT